MEEKIERLLENWKKRNITGFFCKGQEEAIAKVLEIIPFASTVGISGSMTLEQLSLLKKLEARGNKIINQYQPGISRQESLELRKQGTEADYYLASANAISENGELVFFSAYGNRTCGVADAKNAVVICGINKLAENLTAALRRAREYATPLNCQRLNWNAPCLKDGICREKICLFPEYKRMCCQVLVIEAEVTEERMKVVLVAEELGF